MTIETFIDKLNEIYSIQKPLSFDSQEWDKFRIIVDTCKQSGFSFMHYQYNSDSYQQFKAKVGNTTDEVDSMEYFNYAINHCEANIKDDKLFNQSKEYQNFIFAYLTELKRERDCLFAGLTEDNYFKKVDEKIIQYASGTNSVYDFKIKYYINAVWPQKTI